MPPRIFQLLILRLMQLIFLLLLTGCGGYIDTTQPPNSAIEYMVISRSLNSDDIQQIKVADYLSLPLRDVDITNKITQRWCIALTYINKDDSGSWQDGEISWVLAEKGGSWLDDDLMSENKNGLQYNENALNGTCNWLR